MVVLENFSYGDTPTSEAIASLVRSVLGRGPVFDVSVSELSFDHDVRPLVVRTLLTYLELDGVIRSTGPFYTGFKFQPQKTSEEMIARFDPRRADFLRRVFRHAHKGRTWFSLDVGEVSETIGEPRQRIVAALGYLEEIGDLVVEASGVREGYRLQQVPDDSDALHRTLADRFERREQHDVDRVHSVLQYAEHDGCLTRRLLAYFGEARADCGHCGWCEGVPHRSLPPPNYEPPGDSEVDALRRLRAEGHQALATSRQLARFLCGLSSPATTRARLRQHAMFGIFHSVPFHQVLGFVDKHA